MCNQFLFINDNFHQHVCIEKVVHMRPIQKYSKFGKCATNFPSIKWRFSSTSPSLKNIQKLVMCDQFSFNKMTIFINIAPIEKCLNFGNVRPIFLQYKDDFHQHRPHWKICHSKHFVSLQTLFPRLKIAIFCRIAPQWNSWINGPRSGKIFWDICFFLSKLLRQNTFYLNEIAIFFKIAPHPAARNSMCR